MKRTFKWVVLVGGVVTVLGVLLQSFTIAAYASGAGSGALDAHGGGSLLVHIGQLAVVISVLVAYWGNWPMVGGAIAFLVLSIAQLAFIKPEDEPGDWVNGLHGFLALVILICGMLYAQKAWRELRPTASPGAAGSA
jgi:phosphatidylglycerophosphate synthase